MHNLWNAFNDLVNRANARPGNARMEANRIHKVLIYDSEIDRVAQLTVEYPDIETGGSLFGYWTHSGSPVVSYVAGPGQSSQHNVYSFYQDERYLHDLGTELYDQHGLQHVGEWHSHHRLGLNQPSSGDVDTVRSGMAGRNWLRFLLLIATIEESPRLEVLQNFFLFSDGEHVPEPLRILLLPGSSPFARPVPDSREEPRRHGRVPWREGPSTPGRRQQAEEVFRGAWFVSTEGKAKLVRVLEQFESAGIESRISPAPDGHTVKLVLPRGTLILDRHFPERAPQWLDPPPASEGEEDWSTSTDIVQWYKRAMRDPDRSNEQERR